MKKTGISIVMLIASAAGLLGLAGLVSRDSQPAPVTNEVVADVRKPVAPVEAVAAMGPEPMAQYGGYGGFGGRGGGYGGYSAYEQYASKERDIFPGSEFTFARIHYNSGYGRSRGRGGRWDTDYPESDVNFMIRLAEVTTIEVNKDENGEVKPVILTLTDPDLFKYPFIYMLEVSDLEFMPDEREILRDYLLRGGFLLIDDFWGWRAWQNMAYELAQVLPPDEYPIRDIPLDHELFRIVFDIKEVPQVPSVGQYDDWLQTGITYERGHDYQDPRPHLRGIFDKNGRLMVVLMHNSDLGDGWEREGENYGYFRDFSIKKAYPLGINIVVYAMTH